jgi:protein SDA1
VTRLVGLHKLTILSLYSWFARYLTPKQASVTSFLASLAQGIHNLVPPDEIEKLVVKIANEFVSEAAASEVAAAGINAIREIAVRQPLCMNETLLQDLVQYQKSKDKGVVMAAKGLQSLYREVYPELLQKKYRGKEASMGLRSGERKQWKFGEEEAGGIDGIELLEKYKEEQKEQKKAERGDKVGEDNSDEDDGFNSDEWEVASSDSDDSSTGWINVSDSEDEEPAAKRPKTDSEAPELTDQAMEDTAAEASRISKLATTTILTPADLLKLQELRREANIDKAMGGRSKRQQELIAKHIDEGVTADDIELPAQLGKKSTKEERVALAKDGKPGREEHKSTQAIRKSKKEAEGKSTTNKEKARKKNFLMTIGKARAKNKRSLVDTKRALKAHVQRSKSGGRRKNGM